MFLLLSHNSNFSLSLHREHSTFNNLKISDYEENESYGSHALRLHRDDGL